MTCLNFLFNTLRTFSKIYVVFWAFLFLTVLGCADGGGETTPMEDENMPMEGETMQDVVHTKKPLSPLTVSFIKLFLSQIDPSELPNIPDISQIIDPEYDTDHYKIKYYTKGLKEEKIRASALLIAPIAKTPGEKFPLLIQMHGTIYEDSSAPSAWSIARPAEGILEAAQGFYTLVPDYLGFGDSKDSVPIHPYIISHHYVNDALDALRAAKEVAERIDISLSDKFFIRGYSEGGYAALALQRAIERDPALSQEFKITASAPASGPYDLVYSIKVISTKTSYPSPAYIPYVTFAYKQEYGFDIEDSGIFQGNYGSEARKLIESKNSSRENIDKSLTEDITKLLTHDFLTAVEEYPSGDSVFKTILEKLEEQSLLTDWPSDLRSPTRLYVCTGDDFVPPENTQGDTPGTEGAGTALGLMNLTEIKNSESVGIVAEAGGHKDCPLYDDAILWFKELR